jgi:hypothetical protein
MPKVTRIQEEDHMTEVDFNSEPFLECPFTDEELDELEMRRHADHVSWFDTSTEVWRDAQST